MPNFQSLESFETERLVMKATSIEDADFMYSLMNSPKWLKYIGDRDIKTIKDAIKYIEDRIRPQFEKLGFGNYTVHLKESKIKIGSCGLYDREGLEGLDIGFAFLPLYEGNGYASESSKALIEQIRQEYNILKIGGICTRDNIASQKLLRKLGLEFEKIVKMDEDGEELMYYSINFPILTSTN